MTGAGTATVAFSHEQTLAGDLVDSDSDGNPDAFKTGRNPSVTELELSNALERMREDGAVEPVDSVATRLDGAVSVEAVVSKDVHGEVEKLVFNDAGSGFKSGRASSATFYLGLDFLSGTAERELSGCIPLEYSIDWENDGMVSYSLSMAYVDETTNTSITPTGITGPSDGNDVPFHGFSLSVDGASVSKLQSASLSISNIARFQWGDQRQPVDAVIENPETTLDVDAIFSGPSRMELAYGSAGASATEDSLSNVSGSIDLSAAGSAVSTYQLAKLKPDTYGWNDLVSSDTDTTDSTSFHVNGGVTIV
ncbi:phage tail tube protein [Halorussus salinus]|uniref:phage tail tube protein n=1 Tax=Halorussus salinus TaxID=1364935 RepID=UPI001091A445|nr:phage tail tube protein [Halorussus salinus]